MSLSARTALSFWNAAVRDFPKNAIDALYANEAWDLADRVVKAVSHETYPVFAGRYMSEGVLTQVSDEIALSSLSIMYGGWEKLVKLETTMSNVQRLLTSQEANKQGPFTTALAVGDNTVYLSYPMPDLNWIFDTLSVTAGSYTIVSRAVNKFVINASEVCTLTWAVARTGSVTTEVITTVGASLQDITVTKSYDVVAGNNTLGWDAELLDGYTVYPPIISSGEFSYEITSYASTYLVINCTGPGTLSIEVIGQAVINGTLISSIVELRGLTTLASGDNTVVFADETDTTSLSDYVFASLFNYNANGSISYLISNATSTGFSINSDEATTLMWRVKQEGISLSGTGSGSRKRICFPKTWAEFNTWNTEAKQNQYSIAYYLTGNDSGGMKIQIKKGYGLSTWQSFIIRYPRTAGSIVDATSAVDLLDGLQMELGILLLRWMVAHRSTEHPELLKLVEGIPGEMQKKLGEIYATANMQYVGDGQKLLKKAA